MALSIFEGHLKHMRLVFDRLDAANLKLKAKNCNYFRKGDFRITFISE